MWLALLKNPLTKFVAEKTIGAVTHKLKKDQIVREREIENAKNVDIQSLKSSDNSLKDEWLVIVFSLIFIGHFVPVLQDAMQRGWEILSTANDYFWIVILTIVGGSFGSSSITKFIKKK
jgi:menaquinone-dependent protoporphyrinogen IX oxidase